MTGRVFPFFEPTAAAAVSPPSVEVTIPQLQTLMSTGQLTSRDVTEACLGRIGALNPLLSAVIETNPNAVAIATSLDSERRAGQLRGPLHGIPILVKDNIATADALQTTAGSLALVDSRVPADAPIIARLRAAVAATLCAAAVGTETDGSIVCPSGNNLIVGLKPSIGLVSQGGIIPIAHSQDTAGPMARTVTDVAILLGVMQTPFGPVLGRPVPPDYTRFLQRGALNGARIGVDQRYFTPQYGAEPDLLVVVERAMAVMAALGATLVPTDTGDFRAYFASEAAVLLAEFKVQIAEYLATLKRTSMRTLADLIAFNLAHCPTEMKYFGQELFELAESTSGNLSDPLYLAARAHSFMSAGPGGIDAALQRDNLDAIIAPSDTFASSPAAVAGYPNISIPVGLTPEGKPAGIWMYSGFLREPRLLAFAYDLEQAIQPRVAPELRGAVPPEPAHTACGALSSTVRAFRGNAHLPHHLGTGKPFLR